MKIVSLFCMQDQSIVFTFMQCNASYVYKSMKALFQTDESSLAVLGIPRSVSCSSNRSQGYAELQRILITVTSRSARSWFGFSGRPLTNQMFELEDFDFMVINSEHVCGWITLVEYFLLGK